MSALVEHRRDSMLLDSSISPETVVSATASALLGVVIVWLTLRRQLRRQATQVEHQKAIVRELEAKLHQQRREAAAERNVVEIEHQERSQAIREGAFEEGRQLGVAEARSERVTGPVAQEADFAWFLLADREEVIRETREKTKAEFELQSRLFDVSVRPYLKVHTVKGLFKDEDILEAGYQYQLLVNGIPAFQPSVVIEETRRGFKMNEENIKAVVHVAERAARTAAELYLGAGGSVAKLGPAIIRRIAR